MRRTFSSLEKWYYIYDLHRAIKYQGSKKIVDTLVSLKRGLKGDMSENIWLQSVENIWIFMWCTLCI